MMIKEEEEERKGKKSLIASTENIHTHTNAQKSFQKHCRGLHLHHWTSQLSPLSNSPNTANEMYRLHTHTHTHSTITHRKKLKHRKSTRTHTHTIPPSLLSNISNISRVSKQVWKVRKNEGKKDDKEREREERKQNEGTLPLVCVQTHSSRLLALQRRSREESRQKPAWIMKEVE